MRVIVNRNLSTLTSRKELDPRRFKCVKNILIKKLMVAAKNGIPNVTQTLMTRSLNF